MASCVILETSRTALVAELVRSIAAQSAGAQPLRVSIGSVVLEFREPAQAMGEVPPGPAVQPPIVKRRSAGNRNLDKAYFNVLSASLREHYNQVKQEVCVYYAERHDTNVNNILVGNWAPAFKAFIQEHVHASSEAATYYKTDPLPTRLDEDGAKWFESYFQRVMHVRRPRDRAAETAARKKRRLAESAPVNEDACV